MDRVHKGGPWTWSTAVVHGPGVHVLYTFRIMAEKFKEQTVLSPTFKTDASSVHFLQRTNTILPCIYHVAEPEPTKFTKYHALNIARVDL